MEEKCVYCQSEDFDSGEEPFSEQTMSVGRSEHVLEFWVYQKKMQVIVDDEYDEPFIEIEINCCPMCGRKL